MVNSCDPDKILTKGTVYRDGRCGVERYRTMLEAVNVVKSLKDRSIVKGIALYVGGEYQETIPIGGLT
jgi:hypothetical protein